MNDYEDFEVTYFVNRGITKNLKKALVLYTPSNTISEAPTLEQSNIDSIETTKIDENKKEIKNNEVIQEETNITKSEEDTKKESDNIVETNKESSEEIKEEKEQQNLINNKVEEVNKNEKKEAQEQKKEERKETQEQKKEEKNIIKGQTEVKETKNNPVEVPSEEVEETVNNNK